MLNFWWKKMRRGQRGFTLIELVVVLAILGILIALAVPRYLGARKNALVAEADNVLQEMKTLAWAYYQQYSSWEGTTTGNVQSRFGFTAPAGACWTFGVNSASQTQIVMQATAAPTAQDKCRPLATGNNVQLTLNDDGSSSRTASL